MTITSPQRRICKMGLSYKMLYFNVAVRSAIFTVAKILKKNKLKLKLKLKNKINQVHLLQILTLCTYNSTYWICSLTVIPLIFILIYSLYVVIKLKTFNKALSNTCSLTTSILATIPPLLASNAVICSWSCLIMAG